ncbi:MAG TPA: riboflavin synthase [Xanthomonadales bacterium]|nr:riboflavin synthase [Xanthomonadales bacterium]
MFTGLVQGTGMVRGAEFRGGDLRLVVEAAVLAPPPALGDSIAVNGVCLTVVEMEGARLAFDLSRETLDRTTLGSLRERDHVNLEPALRVGDALGGHMVSGHVDGVATVASIEPDARAQRWRFAMPAALMRFVAPKGSICLDGVSLTVNGVDATGFDVAFIPHTLAVTTFGARRVGDRVNVEVDLVARYLDRLIAARGGAP